MYRLIILNDKRKDEVSITGNFDLFLFLDEQMTEIEHRNRADARENFLFVSLIVEFEFDWKKRRQTQFRQVEKEISR